MICAACVKYSAESMRSTPTMNILLGSVHITMLLQTTGTDENCRLTEAKAAMDLKQGPVRLRILTLAADHNQLVFLTSQCVGPMDG